MKIESYTVREKSECEECGGTIPTHKGGKLFQIVLDDDFGIEGPFCSEPCVQRHLRRDDEQEARIKLHMAAADLLAACEAAVDHIANDHWAIKQMLVAAIAKAKS